MMCLFLRENVSFRLIPFPKRSERIVSDKTAECLSVFCLRTLKKQGCSLSQELEPRPAILKGPHLHIWVSKYAVRRLGQIQAVVTNALAKQRYNSAIYIFSYCMDPKHAVPSLSPSLTTYSRSLASPCHFCLSAPSFTPSIVSFPNRWGLKPPLSALFLTTSPSCKWGGKKRGKKTLSRRMHLQIPLIMQG